MAALSPAKLRPRASLFLACLALLSSAALSGCTIHTGKVTQYYPEPAAVQPKVDCLLSVHGSWPNGPETPPAPSPLMGSAPKGFVPEKVFLCRPGAADGNGVQTISQGELSGDFTALLAALAEPSDKGEANVVCPAMMELRPGLWLVNAAGDAVQVKWPTDTCDMTFGKPDTQKAIDALQIADIKVLPVPGQGK